jgi:hypothetical protein
MNKSPKENAKPSPGKENLDRATILGTLHFSTANIVVQVIFLHNIIARLPMQIHLPSTTAKDRQPKPSASAGRAARQLLQHCLNTAQQGPRRQLKRSLALHK